MRIHRGDLVQVCVTGRYCTRPSEENHDTNSLEVAFQHARNLPDGTQIEVRRLSVLHGRVQRRSVKYKRSTFHGGLPALSVIKKRKKAR